MDKEGLKKRRMEGKKQIKGKRTKEKMNPRTNRYIVE